jgi:branched-chain amino acid transport system substrate-binding protein
VLRLAGADVSRENIMRVASNIVDMVVPNLIPGIVVNTSPTDFAPIEQFTLARFDGTAFVPFGEVIDVGD